VLALAMAFAPVALDVCHATCALHAMESAASADGDQHHGSSQASDSAAASAPRSCHHAVATSDDTRPQVTGIPHACGHSDEVTVIGGSPGSILVQAPAIVATAIEPVAYGVEGGVASVPVRAPHSNPTPLSLPLRV